MLKIFHDDATYQVFALTPDLQAYRTDRFEGWTRQPAEVGPVLFSNTSSDVLQPHTARVDFGRWRRHVDRGVHRASRPP